MITEEKAQFVLREKDDQLFLIPVSDVDVADFSEETVHDAEEYEFIDNPAFYDIEEMDSILREPNIPECDDAWYIKFLNGNSTTEMDSEIESKRNVLTKEEERNLFLRYNFLKMQIKTILDSSVRLSKNKKKSLIALQGALDRVTDLLISYNLALVLNLAKKFSGSNLSRNEMVSEGNFKILQAIKTFNVEKGYKFSTYLYWSISREFGKQSKKLNKYSKMFPVPLENFFQSEDEENPMANQDEEPDNDFFKSEGNHPLKLIKKIIKNNEATLSETELVVLRRRFFYEKEGEDSRPTLREISKSLDMRPHSISTIEKRALSKIREYIKQHYDHETFEEYV